MANKQMPTTLSVLRHLAIDTVSENARLESRARQRHLPPISVYRWWARRTESVSGAIIEAINADVPGRLQIADTFAGGGVIALAALLRGHQVYAQDVNPWAAQSLATMLDLPAPAELAAAADRLQAATAPLLRRAYSTRFSDGTPATLVHTIRVAVAPCPGCSRTLKLFPTALISLTKRVDLGGETGYLACPAGHVHLGSALKRRACETCGRYIRPAAQYTKGRTTRCVVCRWTGRLADLAGDQGFHWEVALVERVASDGRREIARPSVEETALADSLQWKPGRQLPAIQPGIETPGLIAYGMRHWHDLYPARQRVVIESLLCACHQVVQGDRRLVRALEAAVIGSTEMAGLVSRWDARYLKSYEAVASHRFNLTSLAVEPNVWGVSEAGRGTVERRLIHMQKAALWLQEQTGRPLSVEGPKPASSRRTEFAPALDARIVAGSSQRLCLPDGSLHACVTDPPYTDLVQYGELSDLFRAWAGQATGALNGDATVGRITGPTGLAAYQQLLSEAFQEIRRALRPEGHLVLSYANREPAAWIALFTALDRAGFQAVGYTVVHSENETDHAKVGRRACNLDVLLDLVPAPATGVRQFRPRQQPSSDEAIFCQLVGEYALRIGRLSASWETSFRQEAKESGFLR